MRPQRVIRGRLVCSVLWNVVVFYAIVRLSLLKRGQYAISGSVACSVSSIQRKYTFFVYCFYILLHLNLGLHSKSLICNLKARKIITQDNRIKGRKREGQIRG